MKNRKIILIIFSMIILLIVSLFYYQKYYSDTIDYDIINKNWYKYDPLTGYYEILRFKNDEFIYKTSDKNNEYNNCSKYTYDKKNKIFDLDCGKKIKIQKIENNMLLLVLNKKEESFYDNINDTLNNEFENYYKKNLSEYKKELNRVKELISINFKSLLEILSSEDNGIIYIIGDNCSSIECTLVLEIMEKIMSKKNNIYYLDVNALSDDNLVYLNKITNNTFNIDRDYYNGIYPKVFITNKNQIIDKYDFICDGLNCSKYLDD
ncbi:MAG: hypothetical protein PUA90_02080 [bacterium]|nr:hypothetical protein [bacterium]